MRGSELANDPDSIRQTSYQMVLVVGTDGVVFDILQAPQNPDDGTTVEMTDSSIEAIWPSEQCDRIKQFIKRTIRTRQVHTVGFEEQSAERHYEAIFVPHGRDRALMVVRDVSAQKIRFDRIQQLAYVDEATKLPNREFLLDELRKCTEKSRLTESRAAIVCLEIDQVDTHGNIFSSRELDMILKELAARFTHELRGANDLDSIDTDRYSIVARIDFRRFGVVLPCIESGTDAEGVAKRLSDSVGQPIQLGSRQVRVMARAGIALFPQDGTDAETLYENGIVAMEDATNTESVQIKFHSGTVKLRALQRQDVEHELRTALEREEFELNFLPIVDATSDRVVSIESLLRWPQTTLGSQSIQKVVSVAERTGLIVPIGKWVLEESCEQLVRWRESGHQDIRVSVNLSAQEFSKIDLGDRLSAMLETLGVSAESIDLEINEYMLFRDAMKGYATCTVLKSLGFGVVVDDYGTGACSLAHLARSPVDAIKIDNSFVANSVTDSDDRDTCAAVTAMAHQLKMKVIAEGVETAGQAEMLRKQGCDYLQGFHFCRPSSADAIGDYLQQSIENAGSS